MIGGPPDDPLYVNAALLAAAWKNEQALAAVRRFFTSPGEPARRRAQALDALVTAGDGSLLAGVTALFANPAQNPVELRSSALASLAHLDDAWVADVILGHYGQLEPELRPRAIELLTERRAWAERLLDAIGSGEIPASALNANQVRQLLARGESSLVEKVKAQWGSIRDSRDPKREEVIGHMRSFLRKTPGDAHAGQEIFKRVCGQCHKLHGEGQEIGPDITLNGRNSFEQLLSNVFDPSLVIGAAYQARTIVTADGRVLTGLVGEESPQRVVLKMQGGKQEVVPRDEIDIMKTSELSLMPEDLEKQLKPQELADLFAYITLDKPPNDPTARKLPGSQPIVPRRTTDRAKFDELVGEIAPQFSAARVGRQGLAIVAEHAGREGVLRTTPIDRRQPCVLRGKVDVPTGEHPRLILAVSNDAAGAWNLEVKAGGKVLHEALVGGTSEPKWRTISIDLAPWAGKQVSLELVQGAADERPAAAYWARVEVVPN